MSEEEKEQKPKKMFIVTHIVYDDGEIDTEMYEMRKNASGRGAPGKWRLGKDDFKRRVEELLGEFDILAADFQINIGAKEFKTGLEPLNDVVKLKQNKAEASESQDSPKTSKKKEVKDEDLDDTNFGEFDSP